MTPQDFVKNLERNLKAIEEHRPILHKSLQAAVAEFKINALGTENESFAFKETSPGELNVFYARREPRVQSFYHAQSPVNEAQQTLKSVDAEQASVVVFLGFGLGYNLKEFLKNRPSMNFMALVIEKNTRMFLRALCIFDWSKELEDLTIDWIVSEDAETVKTELHAFFVQNTTVDRNLKIIPCQAALMTEETFYHQAAINLMSMRDLAVIVMGNSVNDQMIGINNCIDNLSKAFWNPGFEPLWNKFPGKVCLSIAAGPDVNHHWDTIKALQGKVPIIACDTLVKPMNERGIAPDFITAIERDDYVPKLFRGFPINDRSSLLAPLLLQAETFNCFKGDWIIYAPAQQYISSLGISFLGHFHPGSSAGNLNIAAAQRMGFKTIIMIGHNLAYGYKTNETHLKGTIDPSREVSRTPEELAKESQGFMVATQDGTDEVPTSMVWNIFRTQIEQTISASPDNIFINTSPKGAKIAGAKLMELSEAVKTYVKEDYDIYADKKRFLASVSEDTARERLRLSREYLAAALERMNFWSGETDKLLQKIQKWSKKITERETEGKKVSVEFLDTAIDEILNIKVEAVNNDLVFYRVFIFTIIPAHTAFEREINEMRSKYKDNYSLKRDFVLKHQNYFEIWERNIPFLADKIKEFLKQSDDEILLTPHDTKNVVSNMLASKSVR